jgi:hypothetical protein
MQPTPGRAAYLGDDGGGASTATICDSADHYRDWLNLDSPPGCAHYARGTRVVVERTMSDPAKDTVADAIMPLVQVDAADKSWSGWTQLMTLVPIIPSGTIIEFKREGNDTLRLATTERADDGPDLGDVVTAKLVRFDPLTDSRDIYVTVLDGKYAGKSGWLFTLEGSNTKGEPIERFSQFVIAVAPKPSVDPNSRTYITHKDIRAFKDMSECDDALHAMSDDGAYERLKDAVAAGDYVDFPTGTRLHVVDDPQPGSVFLIATDDAGNQGCVGRYELPGYAL